MDIIPCFKRVLYVQFYAEFLINHERAKLKNNAIVYHVILPKNIPFSLAAELVMGFVVVIQEQES